MRTTVNLDEDVLLVVKERARRERRGAGAVLSELARQAMHGTAAPGHDRGEAAFHGFAPLPARGPAVSNALVDRLREDEPG